MNMPATARCRDKFGMRWRIAPEPCQNPRRTFRFVPPAKGAVRVKNEDVTPLGRALAFLQHERWCSFQNQGINPAIMHGQWDRVVAHPPRAPRQVKQFRPRQIPRHPARPARRRQHDSSWNKRGAHLRNLARSLIRLNCSPSQNCSGVALFIS